MARTKGMGRVRITPGSVLTRGRDPPHQKKATPHQVSLHVMSRRGIPLLQAQFVRTRKVSLLPHGRALPLLR